MSIKYGSPILIQTLTLQNCTRLGTMHLMSKRKRADTTRIVVLLEALLLPRPRRRRGRQRQLYSYSTKDLSPSHVRLYDTYIHTYEPYDDDTVHYRLQQHTVLYSTDTVQHTDDVLYILYILYSTVRCMIQ